MRVLVAALSAAPELSGVQRHALSLASCLTTLPGVSHVDLAVGSWQEAMVTRHCPSASGRLQVRYQKVRNTAASRNGWFYYGLPSLTRSLSADILHVCYPVPLRPDAFKCPVVVTVHDFYAYDSPRNFGAAKAILHRLTWQQCLRAGDALVCVSDATLSALKRHSPESTFRKATRIYNVVSISSASRAPDDLSVSRPFLLCVAQHRYNKNIELAIRSLDRSLRRGIVHPSTSLLVVGNRGPETPRILRLTRELDLDRHIHFAQGLSDESLLWCYRNCELLLMPSRNEGFGLPAVEALNAGCKVVCSDLPALREVGGSECRYVPLGHDAADRFADAIASALHAPPSLALSTPQFEPEHIALEYGRLYRNLLTNLGADVRLQPAAVPTGDPSVERSGL